MDELLGLLATDVEDAVMPSMADASAKLSEDALTSMASGVEKPTMASAGRVPAEKLELSTIANLGKPATPADVLNEAGASHSGVTESSRLPNLGTITINRSGYINAGSEGAVYSNGDGTVSKVFHDTNADLEKVADLYRRVGSMGLNVPDLIGTGATNEGNPVLVMQEVGSDNLAIQQLGAISQADAPKVLSAYDAAAKTLQDNGVRIDWNSKNMTWDNGKLYILDPSFIKEEPLSDSIVNIYRPSLLESASPHI